MGQIYLKEVRVKDAQWGIPWLVMLPDKVMLFEKIQSW